MREAVGEIDCQALIELYRSVKEHFDEDPAIALSTIALYKFEGVGRVYISKFLNVPERRVRRVVESLSKLGEKEYEALMRVLHSIKVDRMTVGHYEVTTFHPFNPRLVECVAEKVVYFRDLLVINLGDFKRLFMIGVKTGRLLFPLVPDEISRSFVEPLEPATSPNSIVIVWSSPHSLVDEASVLVSLSNLCKGYCVKTG
ncbi:hypothetical protein TCELL_0746 [Thermogladius calderae 1633]|uniref:Uncharacterized protein n=1 Tax=Thermogladius calderae (strain DSM 22663 / VKM B-2946 / 1633) TaxID=1184251 RepID=I3TEI2_THEC1|nr:hypothetical protein [Thermogladius calderae]AFK51170.1 hypothetical protein TCELL_0746 [Thermogladius calderae 1633]